MRWCLKTLLRRGKVSDVVVQGRSITGTVDVTGLDSILFPERITLLVRRSTGPHGFVTARVDDPNLVAELEAARARFAGRVPNPWTSVLILRVRVRATLTARKPGLVRLARLLLEREAVERDQLVLALADAGDAEAGSANRSPVSLDGVVKVS